MSVFAELLNETRDRLKAKHRSWVPLHFDWDPGDGLFQWSCWFLDPTTLAPAMYYGESGEQALRRLVEALRESRC